MRLINTLGKELQKCIGETVGPVWPGKNLSLPKFVSLMGQLSVGAERMGSASPQERAEAIILSCCNSSFPSSPRVTHILSQSALHPHLKFSNWDFWLTERYTPITAAAEIPHIKKSCAFRSGIPS